MAVPYFIADSAQVTVLRSLASTAFGKYGLNLPEGVDLEDMYEVAAPGNEMAYVSSLGSTRRVGGMFRRFVRADVNITAQGEGMVPASDVERVLDEAAKRVSGDFFLESDISKAGLGPWVPMVDFQVGDIANVEIWGRVVPLAVTRIEPKRSEHSDNDWSVHVGGQLISNSEARLAENTDIYNAVMRDRRELAGVKETASRAVKSAGVANDAVADLRGVIGGPDSSQGDLLAQLGLLNEQLQAQGEEPKEGLLPAYLDANVRLWEQQREIDAAQDAVQQAQEERSELIEEFVSANRDLVNDQARTAWNIAVVPGSSDWTKNGGDITATGSWEGQAIALGYWTKEERDRADGTTFRVTVSRSAVREKHISVERTLSFPSNLLWAIIFYRKQSASLQTADELIAPRTLPSGPWVMLREFTAPTSTDYLLSLKVRWDTTRFAGHDIRIRVDDQVIANKSGTGTLEILRPSVPLRRGQTVRFEAYAINLLPGERDIKDGLTRVSWKEEE